MDRKAILYRLTFPNDKIYIGITTKTVDERIRGHIATAYSAKGTMYVSKAIRKYNAEVTRELLCIGTTEYIKDLEIIAIKHFNSLAPHGYNTSYGGETSPMTNPEVAKRSAHTNRLNGTYLETSKRFKGKKQDQDLIDKRSVSLKGRKMSPELIEKLRSINTGKKRLPESIEKSNAGNRGKKHTEESRAKMSAALKGKKRTPEQNAQNSAFRKGKKLSDEHKKSMSEAWKKSEKSISHLRGVSEANKGRKHTEETREKISASQKAYREAKKQPHIIINNLIKVSNETQSIN